MTGDDNAPDQAADAADDAPTEDQAAPSAVPSFDVPAPENVAAPDAESAIADFEVPPPPAFEAVPPPPPASEPVVLPAPPEQPAADDAEDAEAEPARRQRSEWAPNDTWTSASAHRKAPDAPTAEQKAASRAAASRAATARDEAARREIARPSDGGTDGNSYRGWTVTIFAGLAVLLVGAIVLIGFLATNAPLSFPSSDSDTGSQSQEESGASEQSDGGSDSSGSAPAMSGSACAAVCSEASDVVGDEVTGNDDVTWTLSEPWFSADEPSEGATEAAIGLYSSDAGELTFTVWAYDDDPAAEAAFEKISDELGTPDGSDSVYGDGTGTRDWFIIGDSEIVLWSVTGDTGRPWVMRVDGPDADGAVYAFYNVLPI